MNAQFTFDHGTVLTEEQLLAVNLLTDRPVELEEDEKQEDGRYKVKWFGGHYEGNIRQVMQVIGPKNRITIQGLGNPNPIIELVQRVEDLLAEVRSRGPFNEKVGVGIQAPDNALMEVRSTKVLEDSCSDALDEELADGWIIIAACPQPDQRRPDYVLGHREAGRNPHNR